MTKSEMPQEKVSCGCGLDHAVKSDMIQTFHNHDPEIQKVTETGGEVIVEFYYKKDESAPLPEDAFGSIRIRFLDDTSGASVKPDTIKGSQSGTVNISGDEIAGYELLDPKSISITITKVMQYEAIFKYRKLPAKEPAFFCEFYREFDTVAEGERYMTECLGGVYEYEGNPSESRKLEWINFINEGYSTLFKEFPEARTILEGKEMPVRLFVKPPEGNIVTGGYFQPIVNQDMIVDGMVAIEDMKKPEMIKAVLIGFNVFYPVSDVPASSQNNFDVKFGASPDPQSVLIHEMGHVFHCINANYYEFDKMAKWDSDNYGPKEASQLSPYKKDIGEQVSQYATQYFPIEFVAEYFNLLVSKQYGAPTHGGEGNQKLQNYYDTAKGYRLGGKI